MRHAHRQRPTLRELDRKLHLAKQAIEEKRCFLGPSIEKFAESFSALRIESSDQVWKLLKEFLVEIKNKDYSGTHPPMISFEKNIANCELYSFEWDSAMLNKKMYIKFAFKDENFYLVSLHQSDKPSKCWRMVHDFRK